MNPIFVKSITHASEELAQFEHVADQFQFRKEIIYKELEEAEIQLDKIQAVVGRGGMLKPISSGVYIVNDAMKSDLHEHPIKEHASNLGGLIADEIARSLPNAKAYIADPVVVDELDEIARVSGHPLFKRISIFHALNQKSIARQHAKSIMKRYEDMNLIVVHMGGGITTGAHCKGRVIDVNQGLDGEGPFSPERSGTLPTGDLVRFCFSGEYSEKDIIKMVVGNGGIVAHLGTNSAYEAEKRAQNGDEKAKFILEALAYQVAKSIGSMVPVLKGDVDAILLTGGVAHSKWITNLIIERVFKFAPVYIYPGEDEMRALAMNGFMVLKGEVEVKEYV
jgi:butyrate kinase